MTDSMTVNPYRNTDGSFRSHAQKESTQNSTIFTKEFESQLSHQTNTNKTDSIGTISNIKKADIETLFKQVKQVAKKELEALNIEDKELKQADYFNKTIDTIMDIPIEVKIDRDEVNTAILYNRMGISFLDIKRLEVRMELLSLAKSEIEESARKGGIRKDEAQKLTAKVESNMQKMIEQKQNLLNGNKLTVNEQLLFGKLPAGNNINL